MEHLSAIGRQERQLRKQEPLPADQEFAAASAAAVLTLTGFTIMVVEDEFVVAEDLAAMLGQAGATVIGPAESLPHAVRLLHNCDELHCALLDVDLQGVAVFPLATELRAAGVPMMFLTGIGCDIIPDEFGDIPCLAKPTGSMRVVDELAALLGKMTAAA